MWKTALIIWRFQPLHKGHLSLFSLMKKRADVDRVVVMIGSSQESHTAYNPFSFEERKAMLLALNHTCFVEEDIFALPDFSDDEAWLSYLRSLLPSFDLLVSGNEWVQSLFSWKNDSDLELVIPDLSLIDICATKIRSFLLGWEIDRVADRVDPSTMKLLFSFDAVERLKRVADDDKILI